MRRDAELRLWAILKEWGGVVGSGALDVDRLYELIKDHVKDYTPQHYRRLLAAGNGLFWRLDDHGRAVMTGSARLSRLLCELAGPDVVGTNRPGARDMFIPIGENIQHFRANCFAAWCVHREDPMISRATLSKLWGRSANTLRAWQRLTPRLHVQSNYGQVKVVPESKINPDQLPNPLDNPSVRTFPDWRGDPIRTCQLPNTYRAFGYRQHAHKGKARNRREAANGVTTLVKYGAGQRSPRLYWTDAKRLERRNRRADTPIPGWLFLGETRHARRVWELTLGVAETKPDCLARGQAAKRFRHEWRLRNLRVRTFSAPPIMVLDMTTRTEDTPDQSQGGGVGCRGGAGDIHRWTTPDEKHELSTARAIRTAQDGPEGPATAR